MKHGAAFGRAGCPVAACFGEAAPRLQFDRAQDVGGEPPRPGEFDVELGELTEPDPLGEQMDVQDHLNARGRSGRCSLSTSSATARS